MQNPKTGGTRLNPDTRPENIDTYTETNGDQTATYKFFNAHPIISGILDKLAFFRTHAAAVYYNRLAGKTVKQKFDDVDAAVGELNENKSNINHTHNYAASTSAGGSANSAVKLDNSAGSATQPIYFNGGKPVACTYSLAKSVPANAVFTDTLPAYISGNGLFNNNVVDSSIGHITYYKYGRIVIYAGLIKVRSLSEWTENIAASGLPASISDSFIYQVPDISKAILTKVNVNGNFIVMVRGDALSGEQFFCAGSYISKA